MLGLFFLLESNFSASVKVGGSQSSRLFSIVGKRQGDDTRKFPPGGSASKKRIEKRYSAVTK